MRASYKNAIRWIADNDDSDIGNEESGWIISVHLVADLFGKEPRRVALDVLRVRGAK